MAQVMPSIITTDDHVKFMQLLFEVKPSSESCEAINKVVIFMGLIFRGLGSSDNFVGLYFRGIPTLIT